MTTLATVQQVKDYLRIETANEDALLADLITRAIADIEASCGKSLTTEDVTWMDDATTLRIGSGAVTNLILGYVPIDVASVVVTDKDGTVVAADNYTVRPDRRLICASNVGSMTTAYAFDNGPYTITATAGYGTAADYATKWVPFLSALVIDWVAYLYQQRTPGATSEQSAGSRVDYAVDDATGLPKRLARGLRKLRGPVFAAP